jgi:hypothetical protein
MLFRTLFIASWIGVTAATISAQTAPPALEEYVGAYEIAPGLVARIIVIGNRLFSVSRLGDKNGVFRRV